MIRESSIVVRLEGHGVNLLEIPYAKLRELDRRYLKAKRNYDGPSPKVRRKGMSSIAFRLLDECNGLAAFDSPVDLVRAVNHLHGLGKDRALAVLNEYIDADDGSPGTASYCVFTVVPLLFEAPGSDDDVVWNGLETEDPFFVELASDIPFVRNLWQAPLGTPHQKMMRDLTRMAHDSGVFRKHRLRPSDDPFAAAEEASRIFAARQKDDVSWSYTRAQAYACIEHLFPLEWQCAFARGFDDARWDKLKELGLLMRISWSDETQEYVAARKEPLPAPPEDFFPPRSNRR
jgi:hypothetical protein